MFEAIDGAKYDHKRTHAISGRLSAKCPRTLDRLRQSGEVEVLTVDGEPRGVVMSPAAYDELTQAAFLAHDVRAVRESMEDIKAGRVHSVDEVFDAIEARLLSMQAAGGADCKATR